MLRAKPLQVRGILPRLGAIAAITGKVNRLFAQTSIAKPLMLTVLVEHL
ncbi:MAG: hypothetical protein AB1589_13985 [Cyanobacteriota bacterium]